MKSYKELTHQGRMRRLRKVAELALEQYDLPEAKLTYVHSEGNVIYRVDVQDPISSKLITEPFVPNRYNLRILSTSNYEGIQGELTWLAALRNEAGLPVPEPVPTREGKLLIHIKTPGVPQGKYISIMRWVDGHHVGDTPTLRQARAWGKLVAQLHNFAATWVAPKDFERPTWDWDGQLGNGVLRTPVAELIKAMPEKYQQAFQTVSYEVKQVMEAYGKNPGTYGLIHADMYMENLLFKGDQPRLIDFEDCGFGFWMWDFGVIFSQWPWTDEFPRLRDSFFDGYNKVRTLPEEQFKHLDLFMAAQCATMVLWATAFIENDPAMSSENEPWRTKEGEKLLRYFQRK